MSMLDNVGIEKICSMIIEGKSQAQISRELGISPSVLCEWLSRNPERSARAREARTQSADAYADMAEQVLRDAAANQIEISRARELASHYRWMASKRRPAEYGDKQTIDFNDTTQLTTEQIDKKISAILSKVGNGTQKQPENNQNVGDGQEKGGV